MATPDSVRQAITSLHQAIADHSDPECKELLTKALSTVMSVQKRDYAQHDQNQAGIQNALSRSY